MTPRTRYQERITRLSGERDALAAQSDRLSRLRTLAFLVILGFLWAIVDLKLRLLWPAAVLATAVFLWLVWRHARVRRAQARLDALVQLNQEGIARLDRNWSSLDERPASNSLTEHAYAADLDVFGAASLSQLLGRAATVNGRPTLESWLLRGASADVVRQRQPAVQELAALIDWRDEIALHARRTTALRTQDLEHFLDWAEGKPWLQQQPLLRAAAWVLPILTWTFLLLDLWLPTTRVWVGLVLVTLVITLRALPRVHRTFTRAFSREAMFKHYPQLLELAVQQTMSAPLLTSLQQRLGSHDVPAHIALQKLERLMLLADLRLSTLHFPLQLLTLSDVHVLNALERWQRQLGARARDWLAALGELEALAALATLAHDQPEWVFASVDNEAPQLEAVRLGHPLLPEAQRVDNSVTLGPAGTFLFITGSNMSGKSTMLRALGLNIVLAHAGAPACARQMRLPAMDLHTSMRVQDSVSQGVSFFLAELQRLKLIVDAAAQPRADGVAVYLIDEMLHGTNSAERRIAARRVLARLVRLNALGAVTSHDLDLIRDTDLQQHAVAVHFREHFSNVNGKSQMEFDYRLRDGLAPSTNALKLLELVGLDEEAEGGAR